MCMDPELLIFDVYGTLLKADDKRNNVREGFVDFVNYYNNSTIVAFSDAPEQIVCDDLSSANIITYFDLVFSDRDCVFKSDTHMNHERIKSLNLFPGNYELKNLESACDQFKVEKANTVFFGDNLKGKDKDSALYYDIKFVQVPQFRDKLPNQFMIDENVIYDEINKFTFRNYIGKL